MAYESFSLSFSSAKFAKMRMSCPRLIFRFDMSYLLMQAAEQSPGGDVGANTRITKETP